MITIKEIAAMLDISTTTVSNVIHGKTKEVSPETIERVRHVLEEYEYVPNINARNLARNRSKIIGIAIKSRKGHFAEQNLIKDAFTSELLGAVERAVKDAGYFLMIYISDEITETLNYIATWNVDGLIVLGLMNDDCIQVRDKCKKPLVFIDSYFFEEIMNYCNIGLEDEKGAYEMTKYLIDQGHRRIAFVSDTCVAVERERFHGYRKALKDAAITYHDEDFLFLNNLENENENGLKRILSLTKTYTAFECSADFHAARVINYFNDHGVKVPEDASVTGFDDNFYSKFVRPQITTVHQNPELKGRLAVELLVEQIKNHDTDKKKVILPVELKIRDSVKCIK